jgi:hypothetical protein
MMMKSRLGMKAMSVSLTVAMSSLLPGVALAETNVTLTTVSNWQSGNAANECAALSTITGIEYAYSLKINEGSNFSFTEAGFFVGDEGAPNGSQAYTSPDGTHTNTITISNSNGKTFDWSASPNTIGGVIVKAATVANIYTYAPQQASDTGLGAFNNTDISHITFCWNLDEQPVGQTWCSPGYWRQVHHYDSWDATGIRRDELYSDRIGPITLTRKGIADGASTDPTLIQVLNSPQNYGGDSFNAVGDLLSAAHPDVDFQGERVPDSCPL